MSEGVNLTAIVLVNVVGILTILVMTLSNMDTLKKKGFENRIITILITSVTAGCIVDMLCFLFDGRSGAFAGAIVFWGNFFLYAFNMIIPPCWCLLIENHITGSVQRSHVKKLMIIDAIGFAVLLANIFYPVAYKVNENNVYSREPLAILFVLIEVIFVVDCMGVYVVTKRHGGMFKFFPVMQFVIPAITGVLIQQLYYGVSTIWTCMAIAIVGVLFSLQNERIYMDSLTGLYNRAYLDRVKREAMTKKNHVPITLFFLDLDDFKGINDQFGHGEGDKALRVMAQILRESVGSFGSVIRFAGDEFIIALNYQDPEKSDKLKTIIEARLEHYNATAGKPYKLQASIGIGSINLDEDSIDELFEYVDKKMYEEKRKKHKVE